ncbi:MAG: hypothetical protein JSS77_05300 [Acidobacteria bacterium]|nr:hypothetical protein [Acidobacteriota bacterium]
MIFCPDPRHKCRGNSRVRDDQVLQTFGSDGARKGRVVDGTDRPLTQAVLTFGDRPLTQAVLTVVNKHWRRRTADRPLTQAVLTAADGGVRVPAQTVRTSSEFVLKM